MHLEEYWALEYNNKDLFAKLPDEGVGYYIRKWMTLKEQGIGACQE
ncbi:MAG: hypothetical protein SOX46_14065 [Clostridiaceae bacterium]|nr:hypothetical protein [Clostridium porci]MDY3232678.1 hypothetical protein [Clostridiaceae bacterium]